MGPVCGFVGSITRVWFGNVFDVYLAIQGIVISGIVMSPLLGWRLALGY